MAQFRVRWTSRFLTHFWIDSTACLFYTNKLNADVATQARSYCRSVLLCRFTRKVRICNQGSPHRYQICRSVLEKAFGCIQIDDTTDRNHRKIRLLTNCPSQVTKAPMRLQVGLNDPFHTRITPSGHVQRRKSRPLKQRDQAACRI